MAGRSSTVLSFCLLLLFSLGSASGADPAASGQGASRADEHARIVDYWTSTRIQQAQARDMVVVRDGGVPQSGHFGGGGGGGCRNGGDCPPRMRLQAPSDGATVSGVVTISGRATDRDGSVVSVEVEAGPDMLVTGVDNRGNWSVQWDSTGAADGNQPITATAIDDADLTGSASITVVVDNGDPEPPDPDGEPVIGGEPWPGSAEGNARMTTGRVLFTLRGLDYVCSGTLVDGDLTDSVRPSIVLTAGHCVSDGTFATNWAFYPDYESNPTFSCSQAPRGCWTADAIVTTSQWHNSGNFERDVAFVRVSDGNGSSNEITDVIPASQGVGFYSGLGQYVTDFGYPAASPYDGSDLIYCAGDTVDNTVEPSVDTQGLTCDQTGGSSGGAWLDDFSYETELGVAVSVNSYKYVQRIGPVIVSESPEMYGPIFGSWTESVYDTALTASGNSTVS